MAKGIKRKINAAYDRVQAEIRLNAGCDAAAGGSHVARGLSSEGYAGGYAQALQDVLLALNGVAPNTRGYWKEG